MEKSKVTKSQIVGILRRQEAGRTVAEICREYEISHAAFSNWKSKMCPNAFEVKQSEIIWDIG